METTVHILGLLGAGLILASLAFRKPTVRFGFHRHRLRDYRPPGPVFIVGGALLLATGFAIAMAQRIW